MRKAEDGWKKRFGKPKSFRKERKKETRFSLRGETGRKRLCRILAKAAVITVCNRSTR